MKKSLLSIFILLSIVGCNMSPRSYRLSGNLPDSTLNGLPVYVYNYGEDKIIDSAVIKNNNFVVKGVADSSMFSYLLIKDRFFTSFILENGDINIDAVENVGLPTISGTTNNNVFNSVYQSMVEDWEDLYDNSGMDRAEFMKKSDSLKTVQIERIKTFVEEHKNSALDVFGLSLADDFSDVEIFESVYKLVGEKTKENKYIQDMVKKYDLQKSVSVGHMYKDFTIEKGNLDGSSVKLSDYVGKGKYILVDFWASWCAPCRAEIPNIKSIYDKYRCKNFDVVSIAVSDKKENSLSVINKMKMNWNQIVDAQSIPIDVYGINGIPQIMLFAPDGTIIARDLRGEEIQAEVKKALKK